LKRIIAALFLLWTGVLIVAYFIVQRPGLFNAFAGLLDTLWTPLAAALLLFNAYGLGGKVFHLLKFEIQHPTDRLFLRLGIGLGALGLLGLFFSITQLATEWILTLVQFGLGLFFLVQRDLGSLRRDLASLLTDLHLSFSRSSRFTKFILITIPVLAFLLTLVPPFEAFDALFYHLTQPARVLQDGGLRVVDIPHFWFPNLTENVYLWALGLGSERAAQILHFAWALLSVLFLWRWASSVWNAEIARKTLLLLAAMPALPLLASWAYADMALAYYSVAALFAYVRYRTTRVNHWLAIMAIMSGFAISVKYTAFVVPLTCGLLLFFHRPLARSMAAAAQFSAITILTALPYYIRNALLMNNPFYPFAFGGRFWDDFRAAWYADSGTGIGWDAFRLLLLPLTTLLGTQDANFFDGRMGPLFLILAPVTIWIFIRRTHQDSAEGMSLLTIGVFSLLSFGAWTIGVINSSALLQARLLFPVLLPFAIPTALAWDSLKTFDTSRLRISFLANALIAVVLALTVFDQAVFVLQRNPLAVAVGAQTRERYIERINPSYAALIGMMNELPADARVYSLFEPRTYDLPRLTQPDPIIDNFAHDVYLHETSARILQKWRSEQYTHVIVYERGLDFMTESASRKFTPSIQSTLQETLGQLTLLAQTPDHVYSLYEIP
jgi:hypothetical protein